MLLLQGIIVKTENERYFQIRRQCPQCNSARVKNQQRKAKEFGYIYERVDPVEVVIENLG